MSQARTLLHRFDAFGKAMEHAARAVGERCQFRQRVIERIALMNDAI